MPFALETLLGAKLLPVVGAAAVHPTDPTAAAAEAVPSDNTSLHSTTLLRTKALLSDAGGGRLAAAHNFPSMPQAENREKDLRAAAKNRSSAGGPSPPPPPLQCERVALENCFLLSRRRGNSRTRRNLATAICHSRSVMGCAASSSSGSIRGCIVGRRKRRPASYTSAVGVSGNPNGAPEDSSSDAGSSPQNRAELVDGGIMYGEVDHHYERAEEEERRSLTVAIVDSSQQAAAVGAGGGQRNVASSGAELKGLKEAGREEARRAQERLSQSLTTPLVERELKMIEQSRGHWLDGSKDLSKKYSLLPPIALGKKVVPAKGMAFTVGMDD